MVLRSDRTSSWGEGLTQLCQWHWVIGNWGVCCMTCECPLSCIVSLTFSIVAPHVRTWCRARCNPLSLPIPQQSRIGGHYVKGSRTQVYPFVSRCSKTRCRSSFLDLQGSSWWYSWLYQHYSALGRPVPGQLPWCRQGVKWVHGVGGSRVNQWKAYPFSDVRNTRQRIASYVV